MGQVWSKANFDGINLAGHLGGRGSVMAVTAQNAGDDGQWGTTDDVLAPINQQPVDVSIDMVPDDNGSDQDRVRGFLGFHRQTCNFVLADGSTHSVTEGVSAELYRAISTRGGSEIFDDGSL